MPRSPLNRDSPAAARPLIVRLRNYVGDVVLSVPALQRLDDAGYSLHLVGKPWAGDLLRSYGWSFSIIPKRISDRVALLRELRRNLQALDPTWSHRINALTFVTSFSSALDLRLAGFRAAGYATEARAWLLRSHRPLQNELHALDLYWHLAELIDTRSSVAPYSASFVPHSSHEEECRSRKIGSAIVNPYVVLVPYPGGEIDGVSKKWSEFRAVVEPLRARGLRLVMAPSDSEIEFTRTHYPEAISLPGLSLGAYAALMRDAALTISNDTGPGHLAASVGGHLLSVLGPTKPSQWGARGARVTIMQGAGTWPRTDQVIQQMLELLDSRLPPAH